MAARRALGHVEIIAIGAPFIWAMGVAEERGEWWSTRSPRSTPTRPPTPPPCGLLPTRTGRSGAGSDVALIVETSSPRSLHLQNEEGAEAAWADKWWVKRRKDGVLSIVTARALGYYVPEKLRAARWVRCLPSADVPPLEAVKSPVGWWVASTCKWASHTPLTSK